ncbi:MAG: aminotransferase class I/II-fold pyridoxal phosphate-dependent enzyme [Rhizobiaceae bacterium]|nr:aminotransferase class I/II-fold pyridoxal phosphate-dependent enzyme [Rhizobiaceae bacterium]
MKMGGQSKNLTEEQRKSVISKVRQRRNQSPRRKVKVSTHKEQKKADFSELPGFKDMQTQKVFADFIEIENPFFRTHESRASAETTIGGNTVINFASYDYLGLNGHPAVQIAAKEAIDRYGISASASRIVGGERPIHRTLENKVAEIYGTEDAVVFVSGHATNVSTIGQIMQPDDLIIHDAFIHNSILMGIKLSGANQKSFRHNDIDNLELLLASQTDRTGQVLVVVEGIYSMDGDYPDLPRILALKKKYNFWLMVDEAHALGVLGKTGKGLAEHFEIDPSLVDIWMGTFSKTLAGCGGYIAGSRDLTDYIKFSASGFVYSVGMPPPIASSVCRAIEIMLDQPDRVQRLQANGKYFVDAVKKAGFDTGASEGYAVVPIMIGDSIKATVLASKLLGNGVNVLPIIYPAVSESAARLRFFISSEHTKEHLESAIERLQLASQLYEENPISVENLAKLLL